MWSDEPMELPDTNSGDVMVESMLGGSNGPSEGSTGAVASTAAYQDSKIPSTHL